MHCPSQTITTSFVFVLVLHPVFVCKSSGCLDLTLCLIFVSSFPFLNASVPASHYKCRPRSFPVHRGLPSIAPSFLHSTISVSEFIMFPKVALTSLLLLAMSVVATPVAVRDTLITLPFAKHINSTGSGTIVQQDKARIKQLVARFNGDTEFQEDVGSVPVTNQVVSYIVSLGVGELTLNFTQFMRSTLSRRRLNRLQDLRQRSTTWSLILAVLIPGLEPVRRM